MREYGKGVSLFPIFKRLPMGLSHSVQIMQLCHLEALKGKKGLEGLGLLSGATPTVVSGGQAASACPPG